MKLRPLLAVLALGAGPLGAQPPPLPTVGALDVARYMGSWYEIARYPNRFQEKCVGQSRADYRLLADGKVEVVNRCPLSTGETLEAVGLARQIGAPTSPKFEVRFAPAWLSFIPAVWGDYWVVDIEPSYRWAIVSEPRREYLWLLAREPRLPAPELDALLRRLAELGFDTARLQRADR